MMNSLIGNFNKYRSHNNDDFLNFMKKFGYCANLVLLLTLGWY